jgi:hypothetical protein
METSAPVDLFGRFIRDAEKFLVQRIKQAATRSDEWRQSPGFAPELARRRAKRIEAKRIW